MESIGTIGKEAVKSDNTGGAGKATAKDARSTKDAKPSVEEALLTVQDIVRFCAEAGIASRSGNVRGGLVIFLPGVSQCQKCQNYHTGDVCQKCASVPENEPEGVPEREL